MLIDCKLEITDGIGTTADHARLTVGGVDVFREYVHRLKPAEKEMVAAIMKAHAAAVKSAAERIAR